MFMGVRRVSGWLMVGGIFLTSCGDGHSPAATNPTPTPVVVATSTPLPTASPSPFPGVSGCGLPPSGPGFCHERADADVGVFQTQVDETTLEVVAAHPELFAGDGALKNYGGFRVAMIKGLEARGLCVVVDGEELAIKNNNNFSEQWKVELSNGRLRTGQFAYRAVCRPANFPINPTPMPQRGDCSLPSSFSYACARLDDSVFLQDIELAQAAVITERPDLTDGATVAQANWNAYYAAVIEKLRAKGYCAMFDGEELAVKVDNDKSEQFHLILSSNTVRRGFGSYRGTCEPAAY